MLKKLWEKIKEVIGGMFKRTTLTNYVGENIVLTDSMVKRIELWESMLIGKAPWIKEDVQTMGLEKAICQEFTNVCLSEMETRIEGNDRLNEIYQKAIKQLNEGLQDGLALGSLIIKPLGQEGDVEFVIASKIVPLNYNAEGKLTSMAIIQEIVMSEDTTLYRFEYHTLTKEGLEIRNEAYKGTKGEIGRRVELNVIEEWANLPEEVMYPGMNRLDYGFYRNPIANRIDRSFNGVSIYENAVEQIKRADRQNARLEWEFESSERMVFADYTTVRSNADRTKNKAGHSMKLPEGKDRLIVGIDIEDKLDTFNPAIREVNFINGLNEYLRRVEFNCCLAYGDLSKSEIVERTATEIKTSKKRKYDMVNAIQANLRDCLEDLAYALAFYNEMFTTNFNFVCDFKDSILTDEETERNQDRLDLASGIMSPVEYRMKWYNEDEETAKSKLPNADDDGVKE